MLLPQEIRANIAEMYFEIPGCLIDAYQATLQELFPSEIGTINELPVTPETKNQDSNKENIPPDAENASNVEKWGITHDPVKTAEPIAISQSPLTTVNVAQGNVVTTGDRRNGVTKHVLRRSDRLREKRIARLTKKVQ
jgi:hypothetical protein